MGAIYYKGEKYGQMPSTASNLPFSGNDSTPTATKITGLSDRVTALETYSTTETAIGKWIDGKTVYQKVIPINNTISNSWTDATTISGITLIIGAEFLIYEGGGFRGSGVRQGLFAELSTVESGVVKIFNNTGFNIQVDYLILKYIKN